MPKENLLFEKKMKAELEELPPIDGEDAWSERRQLLRDMMKKQRWSNFTTWPVVTQSLYSEMMASREEEKRQCYDRWESRMGRYHEKNGTVIHQMYSIWLWEKVTGRHISTLNHVAEFGAGYGEMALLLSDEPFQSYTIFDFPELVLLQKWYLNRNEVYPNGKFNYTFYDNAHDFAWEPEQRADLLIAICSMSEVSVELRKELLGPNIPKAMLIRYQNTWDGVNNNEWFNEFANLWYQTVHNSMAPMFPNHRYLIAW